jgi:hypothetical protein
MENKLPYLIDLDPKRNSKPGSLIMLENSTLGFNVKRIFYIYGLSDDKTKNIRGNHGHTNTIQFIVCLTGSVDIETIYKEDETKLNFHLNSPEKGLMLLPNNYIIMKNFTKDAVLMVVCDTEFKDEISYQTLN